MNKRVVVIGGGAGGMTAATQIKRQDPEISVSVIDKGSYVSWAGCPTPYYIAGKVKEGSIIHNNPEYFKKERGIDVEINHAAERIDFDKKKIIVHGNTIDGDLEYDELVLSTGAKAVVPEIKGLYASDGSYHNGIFILRHVQDAFTIKMYLDECKCKNGVIIGAGFIGMEMAESLTHLGMKIDIVEMMPSILPMLGNDEQRKRIADSLKKHNVDLHLSATINEIISTDGSVSEVALSDGTLLKADFLLISIGVRPDLSLLERSGYTPPDGKLIINERMETGIPDVYALGDMVWTKHLVTGKPFYAPFGDVADKQGLILGGIIAGLPLVFPGVIGSAATAVFEWQMAVTGLNYAQARDHGFDADQTNVKSLHRIIGFEGTIPGLVNVVYERNTYRVLGASIVAQSAAAQFIDQFAIAVTYGMTIEQLFKVDFAYSPATSVVWNPVLAAYRKVFNR
jgi:NADPH-dependent 2,4-dienoyl-CoA reductase/sulfur reductase-like enzyme